MQMPGDVKFCGRAECTQLLCCSPHNRQSIAAVRILKVLLSLLCDGLLWQGLPDAQGTAAFLA